MTQFGPKNATHPYFRTRERGTIRSSTRNYKETSFDGVVRVNTTATDVYPLVGEIQTTTDVVTPGYAALSKQGHIFNNPFYSTVERRSGHFSGFRVQRNSGSGSTIRYYESDSYYSSPVGITNVVRPLNTPLSSLKAEAGTLARSRVNQPDIEGLVEMAEARKAMDVFRFRLNNFNKFLGRAIRSTSKKRLAAEAMMSSADVISSNWLRYRYGIMPMIYLLEDALVGEKVRNPTRETARGSVTYTDTSTTSTSASGNFFRDTYTVNRTYSANIRAGVLYRPLLSYNRYGLNPAEILPALVELTPYSFVADWFVNVSPYVRSITATVGLKILAQWTTVFEEYNQDVVLTSVWLNYSGHSPLLVPSGQYNCTCVTTTRTPSIDARLTFRRNSIKKLFNGDQRTLDALALGYNGLRVLIEGRSHRPKEYERWMSISPRGVDWSR